MNTRCWLWPGPKDEKGYARIRVGRKKVRVFRILWEYFHGPIPHGKELHHRCKNKQCVNPHHLRLVTPEEHCSIEPRRTSTCPHGKKTKRACRTCVSNYNREYHADHKDTD